MSVSRAIAALDVADFTPVMVSALAGQGSDDSTAINDAIDQALVKHAAGSKVNVIFGPKSYIYTTPHARLVKPVGFVGHGSMSTIINLDTTLSGDAFSWSDVWLKTEPPTFPDFGVRLQGFSIIGTRSTTNQQNALMFYDHTDALLIEDVTCWYVRGRAFASGIIGTSSAAYMRESRISNFRAFNCGLAGFPVIEICTEGSGDSSNSNRFHNVDIFGSYSEGLVIRNKNSVKNIGSTDFHSLRIEGLVSPSPAITADTLAIGDTGTAYAGGIGPINFYGLRLAQPYTGQSALTIQAKDATAGAKIYELNFHGVNIGPGPGKGINIQAGRTLYFQVFDNSVSSTKLTVGAASVGVGTPILFDALGLDNAWTKSVDSTSAQLVASLPRNNTAATVAPDTAKDDIRGYGVGSRWIIPTTGQIWFCRDATTNAAVWVQFGMTEHPGYIVNNWYAALDITVAAGANPGIGSIRWHPVFIKQRVTLSALGVRVSTLFSGGLIQAAIYANNAATFRPTGNALASTSSLSTTTAANVNGAISLQLEAGFYWMATNMDNATAICTSIVPTNTYISSRLGNPSENALTSGATISGLSTVQTFGTWPDVTASSFANLATSSVPVVQFKVGSVP